MAIDLSKIKGFSQNEPVDKTNSFFSEFIKKLQTIGTVSSRDKLFFTQNLQIMIKSGLALDKSLKTLAEQTTNKRFRLILNNLATDTEKGLAFNESLKKYRKVFGDLFISMVEAGEVSGRLEDVMKEIYLQLKKSQELKSRIIGAMTYPVVVVCAMILIGIGMMIFVVPKITAIFDQVDAELPLATTTLINISDFIVNNGLLSGVIFLGFIILLIVSFRHQKTKYYYHLLFIKLPIFGSIVRKINLAKFSRTLSSLIKTDISIVKSFEITADVLGNKIYKNSLLNSVDSLKQGVSLTEVLKKYPKLYPPIILQMVSAGEETGSVDEILSEVAGFYEDEIDQIMKTLPSLIEPVLMLILGSAVAMMAVAIITPMYSLTQHIN